MDFERDKPSKVWKKIFSFKRKTLALALLSANWKAILMEINNSFHEYLTLVNVLQPNKQVWLVLFVELLFELNTVNAYMNEIQSDYHWFVQFYFMVNVDLDTFL